MKTMQFCSIISIFFFSTHLISSKSLQKHQLQTTLMAQRPDVQDLEKTEKNDPCPDTYLPPGKKYKMVDIPYSEKIMTFCGCNRNQRLKSFPTNPDDPNSRVCVDCDDGWYVDEDVHYARKCKKRDDYPRIDRLQTSSLSIIDSTNPSTLTKLTTHGNTKIQKFSIPSSSTGIPLHHFSPIARSIGGVVLIIATALFICLWLKGFCCRTEQNDNDVYDQQKRKPLETSPSFDRKENANISDSYYAVSNSQALLKDQSKLKKQGCISWSHYKKKRVETVVEPPRISLPKGKESMKNEETVDVTDLLLPSGGENLPNCRTSIRNVQTVSPLNNFEHRALLSTTSDDNQSHTKHVIANAADVVLESNSINHSFAREEKNSSASDHHSNSPSGEAPCTSRLLTSSISCQTNCTSSQENKIKCITKYLKESNNEITYDDSFDLAKNHLVDLPSDPTLTPIDRFVEVIIKGFDEGKITAGDARNYFKTKGMSRPHLEMLGALDNQGFLDVDAG